VNLACRTRYIPTRAIPSLPPGFARHFIEGGWRQVERIYGCRDDVVLKWIDMAGGLADLQERRREWLRGQTQVAQGKVAGQRGA